MKKNTKIAALLTAGLLAVTPCISAGMNAFAGATDSYTITVNETTGGYSYSAYQILAGDVVEKDGDKILTEITWATGLDSAQFLTDLAADPALTGAGFTSSTTPKELADILASDAFKGEDKDKKLAAFARIAKNNISAAPFENGTMTAAGYPIDVVGSGYYLVEETGVPDPDADNAVYSRYMLDVVAPMTVKPKRDLPSLDKKITSPNQSSDGKANQVSIGDKISYEITSDMPDMTGYTRYFYVINDTLAEGLTFDKESVAVKIGNATLTSGDDYEVQIGDDAGGYTFQVVFKDFISRTEPVNTPITVTYDAVLNEKANRSASGNLNTADLTYSNNPNKDYSGEENPGDEPGDDDPTGTTPQSQTKTFTANIKLTKVDADTNNPISGAKFRIEGESLNAVLINGKCFRKDAEGTYYKLTDGTFTPTRPSDEKKIDGTDMYKLVEDIAAETNLENICYEIYVQDDGTLEFGGLGAGTYTITEVEAPDGYNKLNPDHFTITLSNDKTDTHKVTFSDPKWSAESSLETITVTMNGTDATAELSIKNNAGAVLPSTGGIGTKLFYIIGGMLAVGSGVVLVTKKRMSYNDN